MKPKRKTPPGFVTIQLTRRIRVSSLQGKITRTEKMIAENNQRIKTLGEINVTLEKDLKELRGLMAKVQASPESVSQDTDLPSFGRDET